MNDHEAQRIAAAMHAARPDWPASSLLTLIRKKLINRPRRDVLVALAWVASEPNSATPARVLEAGPWWRAAGMEGATWRPEAWEPDKICTTCSKSEDVCRSRPRFGDDDHKFVSRARNAADTARPAEAVVRIVADLRDQFATTPPAACHTESATTQEEATR